ncbi:MAG: 3-methyladenine DNA glycosylase/8-oxoguanine DNA glycosylase [Pirellulaceae bacterium]|jgi:3-methyladenine DNA glycosylase/8-oxoguanine DNA glycosylase
MTLVSKLLVSKLPTAVRHLKRQDEQLASLIKRIGPCRLQLQNTDNIFHSLARAIVFQQLSGKAAGTIFSRVLGLYPGKRKLQPDLIASSSDEELRAVGISRNKMASLRDLAQRCKQRDVPSMTQLRKMGNCEIIDCLTQVRGIGRWTVEMLLMFRLGRPDVFPVNDLGIRRGFTRTFASATDGEFASDAEMLERAANWQPYRTVASWYLWQAADES